MRKKTSHSSSPLYRFLFAPAFLALLALSNPLPVFAAMNDWQFAELCGSGETWRVEDELTEKGANANAVTRDGRPALVEAVGRQILPQNAAEVVGALLRAGANPNAVTRDGETALIHAVRAENPNLKVVGMLLQWGADENAKMDGYTALDYAEKHHNPKVRQALMAAFDEGRFARLCRIGTAAQVKAALEAGANANAAYYHGSYEGTLFSADPPKIQLNFLSQDLGTTALMEAVMNRNPEEAARVVQVLLQAGADVNAKTYRATALSLAVALVLHRAGTNVTAKTYSDAAFVEAVKAENLDVIRALVQAGADAFDKPRHGYRTVDYLDKYPELAEALYRAASDDRFVDLCEHDTFKQVATALHFGADANADSGNGYTPLMAAARREGDPEEAVQIVQALLRAGADVNAATSRSYMWGPGWTALFIALRAKRSSDPVNIEVVRALVEAGADVNAEMDGYKPLDWAVSRQNSEEVRALVQILIKAGADINGILMRAPCSNPEALRMFIKAGEDVNEKNSRGDTALILMAGNACSNREAAQVFIDAGADINAKNDKGETAWFTAKVQRNTPMIEVLEKAGAKRDVPQWVKEILKRETNEATKAAIREQFGL